MGIAKEKGVKAFVVGVPKNMDGTVGEQGKRALRFADKLRNKSGCPVFLIDERLTTVQAEKGMISLGLSRKRRKATIDEAAAVLILESHLKVTKGV